VKYGIPLILHVNESWKSRDLAKFYFNFGNLGHFPLPIAFSGFMWDLLQPLPLKCANRNNHRFQDLIAASDEILPALPRITGWLLFLCVQTELTTAPMDHMPLA
jgi:hypothetical protein